MSENGGGLVNKADALRNEGKYTTRKKAIEYWNKAIRLKPDYADATTGRGRLTVPFGSINVLLKITTRPSPKPIMLMPTYNRGNAYNISRPCIAGPELFSNVPSKTYNKATPPKNRILPSPTAAGGLLLSKPWPVSTGD